MLIHEFHSIHLGHLCINHRLPNNPFISFCLFDGSVLTLGVSFLISKSLTATQPLLHQFDEQKKRKRIVATLSIVSACIRTGVPKGGIGHSGGGARMANVYHQLIILVSPVSYNR